MTTALLCVMAHGAPIILRVCKWQMGKINKLFNIIRRVHAYTFHGWRRDWHWPFLLIHDGMHRTHTMSQIDSHKLLGKYTFAFCWSHNLHHLLAVGVSGECKCEVFEAALPLQLPRRINVLSVRLHSCKYWIMSCYVSLLQPESQNARANDEKVMKIYMKILLGAASKTKLKSCALHHAGVMEQIFICHFCRSDHIPFDGISNSQHRVAP